MSIEGEIWSRIEEKISMDTCIWDELGDTWVLDWSLCKTGVYIYGS